MANPEDDLGVPACDILFVDGIDQPWNHHTPTVSTYGTNP